MPRPSFWELDHSGHFSLNVKDLHIWEVGETQKQEGTFWDLCGERDSHLSSTNWDNSGLNSLPAWEWMLQQEQTGNPEDPLGEGQNSHALG